MGVDWQACDIDPETRVYCFPVAEFKYEGKVDADVAIVGFDVHAKNSHVAITSPRHKMIAKFFSGFKSAGRKSRKKSLSSAFSSVDIKDPKGKDSEVDVGEGFFEFAASLCALDKKGKVKRTFDFNDATGIECSDNGSDFVKVIVSSGSFWEFDFSTVIIRDHFELIFNALRNIAISNSGGDACFRREAMQNAAIVAHQGFVDVSHHSNFSEFNTYFMYALQGRLLLFESTQVQSTFPKLIIDLTGIQIEELSENVLELSVPKPDGNGFESVFCNFGSEIEKRRWISAIRFCQASLISSKRKASIRVAAELAEHSSPLNIKVEDSLDSNLLNQNFYFNLFCKSIYSASVICTSKCQDLDISKLKISIQKSKIKTSNLVSRPFLDLISSYEECFKRIVTILKRGLLVCEDAELKGDESVSFSHPGFDAEIFSIASTSIVSCWSIFEGSGSENSISRKAWEDCLSASSVGKELMQTIPDIQHLYDSGNSEAAREITLRAVVRQLHNLAIAQHIRMNRIDFFTGKIPIFSLSQAIQKQDRSVITLDLFHESENNLYIFNPTLESIKDFIAGRNELFSESTIPLWTQLVFLDTLRILHEERSQRLLDLLEHIDQLLKRQDLSPETLESLQAFQKLLQIESSSLDSLLSSLPTHQKLLDDYQIYCVT
jgi:hypothetical protein